MEAINFLNDHYKSYYPIDFHIYNALFFTLKNLNVTNEESLKDKLIFLEDNLNKKDIHLLINYASDYGNLNFITKAKLILFKLISLSSFKRLILEEIQNLKLHINDFENDDKYNLFKYYFPLQYFDFNPYSRLKPRIYYFIRKQLILCDNIEEMKKKLKFDEQFKYFIIDRFNEEEKEISNKKVFSMRVYEVCSELEKLLSTDLNIQEEQYINLSERSEREINRELGFKIN
jgi:hypothetical protein